MAIPPSARKRAVAVFWSFVWMIVLCPRLLCRQQDSNRVLSHDHVFAKMLGPQSPISNILGFEVDLI